MTMTEKNDEQIDTYAASKITDAVEIVCHLNERMNDLRHSAYLGADEIVLALDSGAVRRHARKLIEVLLSMDHHLMDKCEQAKQLKIVK